MGRGAALDRGWRLHNKTAHAAVLVRMDRGAPAIAVTLLPLPDAKETTGGPDAAAFEAKVRQTLETSPGRIDATADVQSKSAADAGRTLLLVRVLGRDGGDQPQTRDHYLLADGAKRAQIVFSYPPDREAEVGELAFPLLDAIRWR